MTIYGHEQCPPCRDLKLYLDRKQIPYEYKDVLKNDQYLEEMLKHSQGQRIFPVVVTDKGVVVGGGISRVLEIL